MPFLSELFTPTFLLFLGLLLLVVSIVVIYFESKMRDQNHKIASMLSLVSTLAEDMNGVKMGLNQVAMYQMGGFTAPPKEQPLENSNKSLFLQETGNLIPVSDDDSDDDTEGAIEDSSTIEDSDLDAESIYDDSDDELEIEEQDVKVLKLHIQEVSDNEIEELSDNEIEEVDELVDDALSVSSKSSSVSLLEKLPGDNKQAENSSTIKNLTLSDLKTINISLEETDTGPIDYKKLPLPKLRTIVTERGLTLDAAKLKKPEILKLLEAE